jgi:branched-chain amino acid transport system substrate-binding protein
MRKRGSLSYEFKGGDQMRRRILLTGFVALVWIVLSFVLVNAQPKSVTAAAKSPIKLGINLDLTGTWNEDATHIRRGYELYLEEIGYTVAGRKIEIIEYDNRGDPKIALEVAKKLIKKDNVQIVGGYCNSAGAVAAKDYHITEKVPMVVFGVAGSEIVTLPGSKYVFRTTYADGMYERILAHYAYETLGYKKMVVFGPNYIGGTGKLAAFTRGFEEVGGKIVQTILHPFGTYDVTPYLAGISPEAEGIFAFEPGDVTVVRFLAQYFESNLKKKVGLCIHQSMSQDYLPIKIFGEQMIGAYSCHHYTPSFSGPENERFKALYKAKYPQDITNYDNEAGYVGMKFITTALKTINGNVEDKEAFLRAMSSTKVQSPCSLLSLDQNNNVVRDLLITKIEKVGDKVQNVVVKVVPQVHQPPQGYTLPK